MSEIGMHFIAQPEITRSGCDYDFSLADAKLIFNQNLTGDNLNSLLSPKNYFIFQESYDQGEFANILRY